MNNNENIKVLLRFSHIGDIILLSGVLLWRYKEFNEKFILITAKGMKDFFKNHPAIIEVKEFSKKDLKGKSLFSIAKNLAEEFSSSLLYDMHDNLRTKILRKFWKNTVHIYNKDAFARRLFLFSSFLSIRIRPAELDKHVVERYALNFTSNIPQSSELMPCIFLDEQEELQAQKFFQKNNPENKKVIAFHPFATHKGKVWKEEYWQELYTKLSQDYFPIIIGIGEEFDWIKAEHNTLNKYSLRESASLLRYATCLITGDSAPLHLAMSVKTPVIALFGATAKEWGFFPLGEKDILLQNPLKCVPCSLHGKKENCPHDYACINGINSDTIMKQISRVCP